LKGSSVNRKQTIVMLIGIVVAVLMGLYPPWVFINERNRMRVDGGYALITEPPSFKLLEDATIDFWRLGAQEFLVAVFTGGLIVTLRDKKDRPKAEE